MKNTKCKKLVKKDRNIVFEYEASPFKSHGELVTHLRASGFKTWKKDRHYKKEYANGLSGLYV